MLEQMPGRRPTWQVAALCRAVIDALDARLNPVTVCGEISGFTRAASGHCYFSIKDTSAQLRCAMFRRAAGGLRFAPKDGDLVEIGGRVGVYEPRGELQLVVEEMALAGQGMLFEQFVAIRAKLEALGLFDTSRKRPLAVFPRAVGVVTSLGAAALHDVLTALQRRAPHVHVVVSPASVQGTAAAQELVFALEALYGHDVDAILLVRGGGAMEDLWAFNDEGLAYAIARSPVPLIAGIGHETDFTIADFVADLRAPTPTAAAEMVAAPADTWVQALDERQLKLGVACKHILERSWQQHDLLAARLGRPSQRMHAQRLRISALEQGLQHGIRRMLQARLAQHEQLRALLMSLGPRHVLRRGYALLRDAQGQPVSSAAQVRPGDALQASLADGRVELRVEQSVIN